MLSRNQLTIERRKHCTGRLSLRFGSCDVVTRSNPLLVELFRQLQSMTLRFKIGRGNPDLMLKISVFGIGSSDFRSDHDPRLPVIFLSTLRHRRGRFKLSPEAAKNINFPKRIEPCQKKIGSTRGAPLA